MERNDNLEVERKFLLKRLPKIDEINYDKRIKITQHYYKNDTIWERIRRSESENGVIIYYHTIKRMLSKGVAEEIEKVISEREYRGYIDKCYSGDYNSKVITKTRYVYDMGDVKWELDKYKDIELMVAEVEIPDMEYDVKIPKWLKNKLIMEVTGVKEFSNKSLAEVICKI